MDFGEIRYFETLQKFSGTNMPGELFDPNQEFDVQDRLRPYGNQSRSIVFITFRTRDAMPADVIKTWDHKKNELIGLDLKG